MTVNFYKMYKFTQIRQKQFKKIIIFMILINFYGHSSKIDEIKAENDVSFILPQISTTDPY